MKGKTIRLCAAALSALLMLAAASCGGGEAQSPAALTADTSPSVTLDAAETTTAGIMPSIPDGTDYGGYEFRIRNGNIADWMVTYSVDADEENGEALNDAIYARNLAVEEALNVKISSIDQSGARSDAEKAIKAGDDAYDIVLDTTAEAFTMATNGSALSFDNIPTLELDKPWWVQSSLRDTSIAGHVYYAISLFDTTHYCEIRGLMFNKTLRESYQLDDPYDLVSGGGWTLDRMKEMGVAVALDLDGDGKWTKDDQFGYTSWSRVGGEAMVYGIGGRLSLSKDEDDYPFFDLDDAFQ
ncbi:MAG: extracellular solute-binding protein, partial [Clostridia bacterium]|nr:extracellular solute-binding protein [Clostridia bacterium]